MVQSIGPQKIIGAMPCPIVKRDALKILSFQIGGCDKNRPMLRLAQCETPGGFHHIKVRVIECREIFSDSERREDFMARFAKLLQPEPSRPVRTIISWWNKFLKFLRASRFMLQSSLIPHMLWLLFP